MLDEWKMTICAGLENDNKMEHYATLPLVIWKLSYIPCLCSCLHVYSVEALTASLMRSQENKGRVCRRQSNKHLGINSIYFIPRNPSIELRLHDGGLWSKLVDYLLDQLAVVE